MRGGAAARGGVTCEKERARAGIGGSAVPADHELERFRVRGGGGDGVREMADVVRGLEQLLSETEVLVRESIGAPGFAGRANERRPTSAATRVRSASRRRGRRGLALRRKSASCMVAPRLQLMSSSSSSPRRSQSSSRMVVSACCSQEKLARRGLSASVGADAAMGTCRSTHTLHRGPAVARLASFFRRQRY